MTIKIRSYDRQEDFDLISAFFVENYQTGNRDGNWLQPAWEYMHNHPLLDQASLNRIGIWEADGRIVGVAHYESHLGEAFFELHAGYTGLKPQLLEYAQAHLYSSSSGEPSLHVYVNDFDKDLEALVMACGYKKDDRLARPMSQWVAAAGTSPAIPLPDGFRLKSLAEEDDLLKVQRVLWRGFNHAGEPPAGGIEEQTRMQSGPHFRKDLTLVAEAPNGEYAAFCGMWYEAANKIAYVEPVATDPDYRRMGLGKALVLEGIRRCRNLGAK
jgi:ribosomal protein S18 acetylase RimI-like enzyme